MQFFLYLIVGGLSFLLISRRHELRTIEVPVIPSSVTSFSLATAANIRCLGFPAQAAAVAAQVITSCMVTQPRGGKGLTPS
jgi:hypothetical protein